MSAVNADVAAEPKSQKSTALRATPKRLTSLAAFLALAAFYALEHPYAGILGDSKIYMGRALADIDASGVGRDLMFRLDGQSQFSLFTPAARWLVAHLQLATGAMVIAAFGGVLWFAGAFAFARQALAGRAAIIALVIFAAPAVYGPDGLLSYAEMLAEPRPYAEAITLFALAAYVARQTILSFALLAVAAALHPIMALAGVAAIGLALCVEDRRWLIAAGAACVIFAIGVVVDAPIAGRLRVLIDPTWLELLKNRNAYLFPSFYDADDLILPIVRGATILLAASYAEGRLRTILITGLVASALGIALAWFAGAEVPSVLLLQMQTWRMWWLTGFLAAFSLGYCAVRLGQGAARDKFVLAMLALAWTMSSQGTIVLAALVVAVFVAVPKFSSGVTITQKIANYTWLMLAVAVVLPAGVMLVRWMAYPATEGFEPVFTKRLNALVGDTMLLGAIALAAFGLPAAFARIPQAVALAGAACLIVFATRLWFDPDSYAREIARAQVQVDLARMTPRDGEILWLKGSFEPWAWLRRPHWLGDIQGAGIVFSRDIGMIYKERADALTSAGLDNGALVRRYAKLPKNWLMTPAPEGVRKICARADAPAYIVAPTAREAALDPALRAKIWTAPALRVEMSAVGDKVDTAQIQTYAVMDCATNR